MIWESTALMTIIDLLVIAVVGRTFWLALHAELPGEHSNLRGGRLAVLLGLILVLLFFALDFMAMHLLPLFIPETAAMELMSELHLNHSWLLVAGGLVLIAAGFTATDRKLRKVIENLSRSETKQQMSQAFQQDLLDMSPVAISVVSKADGEMLLFNERVAELHRLPASDLANFKTPDMYFDPDERAEVLQELQKHGRLDNYDIRCRRLGTGEECWFSISATPIEFEGQEAILSAVEDVTDRKNLEARLEGRKKDLEAEVSTRVRELEESNQALERAAAAHERAEDQYRELLATAPDSIIQVDFEGKILEFNKAAEESFGYRRGEAIGQSIEILVPEALRKEHVRDRHNYVKYPSSRHMAEFSHLVACRKDGREFPVEISLHPTTVADRPIVIASIRDISKRRRAEAELELRAAVLDDMVEGVNLVRASDGMIVYTNPACDRILGYAPGELVGQHISRINVGNKQAQNQTYKEISESLRRHGSWWGELRNKKKDGTSTWIRFNVSTMDHAEFGEVWVGIFADISEEREFEEQAKVRAQELEKSEAFLSEAQRIAKIGSWEWNIETNELWWSDETYRLLGAKPQSFKATYGIFLEHVHPYERAIVEDVLQRALSDHEKYSVHHRVLMVDGTERVMHSQGEVEFEADGRPIRMTGTMQDITERERVENALQDSERRARQLQADLHHVARVSAMGEMASTLAHELNQPLTALTNYVQAARKTMGGREAADQMKVAEYMDNAVAQSSRAGEILRGLRKFITKGDADKSLENINSIVEEAVLLVAPEGRLNGKTLETNLAPDLPAIPVEKIRIQQIVVNLVRNGFEAISETAGGRVQVTTGLTPDDSIEVTITDNGPGLAEEMAGKLFQSFETTKPTGMGLGLSICRSIIENHAGKIWAEDNPEAGMSFHFTLPRSIKGPPEDG